MKLLLRKITKYLSRLVWHSFVNHIASAFVVPSRLRCQMYRMFGLKIKSNSVMPDCFFMWRNIEIGYNTYVNRRCFFDAMVVIGDQCDIACEVMFCASTHEKGIPERRAGKFKGLEIHIGNGCWIGARALILPGVTIGEGCVIAAGSVVTKDCAPHGVYAGVPARRIRDLNMVDSQWKSAVTT